MDILVNFSETSNFGINIKINCRYLDDKCFEKVMGKFLDSCIYRYRIVTIKEWNFFYPL